MPTEEPYCGLTVLKIGGFYQKNISAYINIPICFLGVISNLLNLLVFTRKTMKSPPNLIFTHLAFVDFMILLIRMLLRILCVGDSDERKTYRWAILMMFYKVSVVMLGSMSVFLTVQLAVWRYIAVVHPLKKRSWCNMRITRNMLIAGYIVCCLLLGIPTYLSYDVEEFNLNDEYTYELDNKHNPTLTWTSIMNYGVIGKLLPSVVLAGFTYRIVVTLLARKTNQEQLTPSIIIENDTRKVGIIQKTNRSTTILFIFVVLFIMAEFPKGILSLLRLIYADRTHKIHYQCYCSLLTIFVTISNVNLSITFVAYYVLSRRFRITFKSLFGYTNPISRQTITPTASLCNFMAIK